MALGLYYDRLAVSGELRQLAVQPGGAVRQVSSQRIAGTGDVFSVTPQVAIGASAWGNPMVILLHANIGYQTYQLGQDVPSAAGTTQRVGLESSGLYIGVWGAELQFPGREGQRGMVRMNRINVGAVGIPKNVFASVSFEGNWMEGNRLRIRSEITPQFSYFLEQARVGADLRPADFTIQVHRDWTLFFGPGFRFDTNIATGGTTLEGYGSVGFQFRRGVSVDLRGGYLGEVRGDTATRVDSTPFGGLNIQINPWGFGAPTQRRVTGDAVPTRRRRTSETGPNP
ncbi:MAG: hypothetical protein HZC29_06825 [Thaumarchaeota archaeon]|nr:hypothetical protein [Nitrososphaerota archaeon]